MRIHVVSDVHGATDDLANAAAGADVFVCLGDLLLYLDYDNPTEGAFAEVFGVDLTADYIALRTAKKFDEARALTAAAWDRMSGGQGPADRMQRFLPIIDRQYQELFAAMPDSTLMTFGNVDVPVLAEPHIREGQRVLDGDVVEVGGIRFGFVGGGLRSPYRTPNEISTQDFDTKIRRLGSVDVLCTHIPPAIAELTFDVVARRFEVGSDSLLALIEETQPQYALFGHVHQPLSARFRVGRTECLNVGHFRGRRTPFVLDL